ncbi:hypothetical protein ACIF9R_14465 [Streptomyces sp. NPDC086080]|uniref:hypothetical protein n=1 Tax=Streptomyces sp. NPDC086080 TaxID=3365748 RepID=UPI0037CFFF8B
MNGFRNFLTRFRPAAAPGRAAPTGVPADRSAELREELAAPLALFAQAQEEARSVREQAAAAAAARRREAERQAEAMVAAAHEEARRVRARTAEQVLRTAESRAASLLAAADREAATVHDRAGNRMPVLAGRVVELVLEDLAAAPASAAKGLGASGRERHEEGGP